jgi:hypothetical protein
MEAASHKRPRLWRVVRTLRKVSALWLLVLTVGVVAL